MFNKYNPEGYVAEEGGKEPFKQAQLDTYEKFMRETSKQMVKNLKEIKKDVHSISSWVVFLGVIAVIGAVMAGCQLIF